MLNVLYKYLILNKTAGIPGIGNFTVLTSAAAVNKLSFSPAVTRIDFEPGTSLADKRFYEFAATEQGISEVDAIRKFQDFAYQLKKNIQSNSFVELTGIGVLKRNSFGDVVLESHSSQNYFPVLTPVEVTNEESISLNDPQPSQINSFEKEERISKDRWWIWATILGILAIAAIAYFYWQERM